MSYFKKMIVGSGLGISLVAGAAATRAPKKTTDETYSNLKVLPKNISELDMERVMSRFQKELGVNCNYCHVVSKNIVPETVDFASDAKPEKNIARAMLKMSIKINTKYFHIDLDKKLFQNAVVWCTTCHRGFPRPITKIPPVFRP